MKLLFGADLVPTSYTEEFFVKKEIKKLFGETIGVINSADRFIVNVECALTKSNNAIKKMGPSIKADPKCADCLKEVGITDAVLSNNHVFDYGIEGLKETLDNLDRVGIAYTGVGENDTLSRKPYIIEQEGKKVAIINVAEHEYTYALPDRMGVNPFDPFLTMQDIRETRENVDYLIVIYHGGKEECRYPSPRLYNLCHEMVHCGADAVLCQHSHCIGCYEEYKGAHILYGQGNFHFCKPKDADGWNSGLMVELNIEDKVEIKFYPIVSNNNGIDLARGNEKCKIIADFNDRNKMLLNGEWRNGWKAFCLKVKDYYVGALKGLGTEESTDIQNQLFAHFLDCEAHTDVWRELYPTWNLTNEK